MNADGSDMHPISVNNVNEFDPSVLPDGRILFGRWEYVDKNALTIQSLWTVNPGRHAGDGLLRQQHGLPRGDPRRPARARLAPDRRHVRQAQLARRAASIALVDPRLGKNDPQAIVNLEHPDDPTCDTRRFLRAVAASPTTCSSSAAGPRDSKRNVHRDDRPRGPPHHAALRPGDLPALADAGQAAARAAGDRRRDRPPRRRPAASSCRTSTGASTGVKRGEVK